MINWFPLRRSMMEESLEFKWLTVAERLYHYSVNYRMHHLFPAGLGGAAVIHFSE